MTGYNEGIQMKILSEHWWVSIVYSALSAAATKYRRVTARAKSKSETHHLLGIEIKRMYVRTFSQGSY